MPVALITGASRGLGRALAQDLAEHGWSLVIDARSAEDLAHVASDLADVVAIPGSVTDAAHRARLAAAAGRLGRLDVLINNASSLGPGSTHRSCAASTRPTSLRRWRCSSCSPSRSVRLRAS
jgi:NAD(P)-dependent dehydrogenase (short-subunit alcohol dehydrogenase family)